MYNQNYYTSLQVPIIYCACMLTLKQNGILVSVTLVITKLLYLQLTLETLVSLPPLKLLWCQICSLISEFKPLYYAIKSMKHNE